MIRDFDSMRDGPDFEPEGPGMAFGLALGLFLSSLIMGLAFLLIA